ncbi:MAG: hypothetical protein WC004_02130 [Candidatus Absconditabacterales bacterium]
MIRFETKSADDGKINKHVAINPLDRKALLRHGIINKAIQAILSESRKGNLVDQVSLFFDSLTGLLDALHVRKGLIVGPERDLMKQKVKALMQSFGDLKPIFDEHWGEHVVQGVAKDFAELNADLDFLEFGELLSQSKERNKLTELLYAIKFMFTYSGESDVGSANLSRKTVEAKLVAIKQGREQSKENLKREYGLLVNEQKRLEQQLGDFTNMWKLFVHSPNKLQEMMGIIKLYNPKPGIRIDHNYLQRIENLAIGEYAFDAPNSLDGQGMTQQISHQNCVGIFRLSASKVVCVGSLNNRFFSDYIAKENRQTSDPGSLYFVVKDIPMKI